VLKTVLDINARRDEEQAKLSPGLELKSSMSSAKKDRHEELRRRGEEKRRLLEALKPNKTDDKSEPKVTAGDIFQLDTAGSGTPRIPVTTMIKRKDDKKFVPLFKQADVVRSTVIPSKQGLPTKHSEHKRKKMRDRERAKREKLRVKKEEKAEKRMKRIDNKPKFKEVIDRPSESIREMGMKLAQKLGKETKTLHAAYDSIGKDRNLDH
jgi:hypothetical protein